MSVGTDRVAEHVNTVNCVGIMIGMRGLCSSRCVPLTVREPSIYIALAKLPDCCIFLHVAVASAKRTAAQTIDGHPDSVFLFTIYVTRIIRAILVCRLSNQRPLLRPSGAVQRVLQPIRTRVTPASELQAFHERRAVTLLWSTIPRTQPLSRKDVGRACFDKTFLDRYRGCLVCGGSGAIYRMCVGNPAEIA